MLSTPRVPVFATICYLTTLLTPPSGLAAECPELVSRWPTGPTDAVFAEYGLSYFGGGTVLMIGDTSDPASPEIIGREDLGVMIGDIVVKDDLAYVAAGDFTEEPGALILVDVSDPTAPFVLWRFETPGAARCIALDERYAYVGLVDPTDPAGGMLQVVDLLPATGPAEVALEPIVRWPEKIAVSEDTAWIADLGTGARAIDLTRPGRPAEIAFIEGDVRDLEVEDKMLFLVDWGVNGDHALRILDVEDPMNPAELGAYDAVKPRKIEIVRSVAYLLSGHSVGSIRLEIIDVTPPSEPTRLGVLSIAAHQGDIFAHDLAAATGRIVHITHSLGGPSLVDATDHSEPVLVGAFETPGTARGVSVDGDLAALATGETGWTIFDVGGFASPQLEPRSWSRDVYARDVVLSGSHAYVAGWFDGIRIFDVSDADHPLEVAAVETGFPFFRIVLSGDYLYASFYGTSYVGTAIVDVSDPDNPVQISELEGGVLAVADGFAHADWSDWLGQCALATWDVSDPANPSEQPTRINFWGGCARCEWPWPAYGRFYERDPHREVSGFASWGSQGWATLGEGGLVLLDLSDPSSPVPVASLDIDACGMAGVAAERGTAFVATSSPSGLLAVEPDGAGGIAVRNFVPLAGFPVEVVSSAGYAVTADQTSAMSVLSVRGCVAPLHPSGRVR
jgi:hypothetical protein